MKDVLIIVVAVILIFAFGIVFGSFAAVKGRVVDLERKVSYLEENVAAGLEADYAKWRCTHFLEDRCVQYTERTENSPID